MIVLQISGSSSEHELRPLECNIHSNWMDQRMRHTDCYENDFSESTTHVVEAQERIYALDRYRANTESPTRLSDRH